MFYLRVSVDTLRPSHNFLVTWGQFSGLNQYLARMAKYLAQGQNITLQMRFQLPVTS